MARGGCSSGGGDSGGRGGSIGIGGGEVVNKAVKVRAVEEEVVVGGSDGGELECCGLGWEWREVRDRIRVGVRVGIEERGVHFF